MSEYYDIPGVGLVEFPDGTPRETAYKHFNVQAPTSQQAPQGQRSGVLGDVARGVGGLSSGIGSALRDTPFSGAGQSMQDWGNGVIAANPADYNSISDIHGIGDVFGFAGEKLAETAPQLAGALGAGILTGGTGAAVTIGGLTAAQTYGDIRQSQREKGIDDRRRAAVMGLGAGALDAFTGAGSRLVRAVGREAVEQVAKPFLKDVGRVAISEGATETAQQAMQRYGSYNDLASGQAFNEYATAGLAGGLVGGAIGAASRPFRGRKAPLRPIDDTQPENLLTRGYDKRDTWTGPQPERMALPSPEEAARYDRNYRQNQLTPEERFQSRDGGRPLSEYAFEQSPEGTQGNLFGFPDAPPKVEGRPEDATAPRDMLQRDPRQLDMLEEFPTTNTRQGFSQSELVQRLTPEGGKPDGYTNKVAATLAGHLYDGNGMEANRFLEGEHAALETANVNQNTIDSRLAVLDKAAQELQAYSQKSMQGYADEGMNAARPGVEVDTDPAAAMRQQIAEQQNSQEAQMQQAQAAEQEQMSIGDIRQQTLQDILEHGNPKNIVPEFMKFVASGKGKWGEVGLRDNERALLEQAREIRRKREDVRVAMAEQQRATEAQEAKQANGESRRQQMEQRFQNEKGQRETQRALSKTEATREEVPVIPETAPQPTLADLMARAKPAETKTGTVLDRADGPTPKVKAQEAAKPETVSEKIKQKVAAKRAERKPVAKPEAEAKKETPKPKARSEEKPAPKNAEPDEVTYDSVLKEAESYLAPDGESGLLKPKEYQQLSVMAERETFTPEELKQRLDEAVERRREKAVSEASGVKTEGRDPRTPGARQPSFSKDDAKASRGSVEKVQRTRKQMDVALSNLKAELERLGIKQAVVSLGARTADDLGKNTLGKYDPEFATIRIAYDMAQDQQTTTLHHEVMHYLSDIGVITEKDWETLNKSATENTRLNAWYEREYKGVYEGDDYKFMRNEEIIAEMFSEWMRAKAPPPSGFRGIVERVKRFFQAVFSSYHKAGFDTAEDIFRAIDEGRKTDEGVDLGLTTSEPKPAMFRKEGTAKRSAEDTIRKLPAPLRDPAFHVWDTIHNAAAKGKAAVMFTEDLIDSATKLLPSGKDYVRVMVDKVTTQRKLENSVNTLGEDHMRLPDKERGIGKDTANGVIQHMTEKQAWGFQPEWLSTAVTVDPEAERIFNALSAKGQAVAKGVFRENYNLLQEQRKVTTENVNTTYDRMIAAAKEAGDEDRAIDLEDERKKSLKQFSRLLSMDETSPYASTRRYGNYLVVGKSPEMRAAIEAGDTKEINRLKTQGEHYFVNMYETMWEAKQRRRELIADGEFSENNVEAYEKDQARDQLVGGKEMMLAFQRLREYIANTTAGDTGKSAEMDTKVKNGIERLAMDLYLRSMQSTSSRKSELRRMSVEGGAMDMMRNFVTQSRATSHLIGALKHNEQVLNTITKMRAEAGSTTGQADKEQAMRVYNEIMLRHLAGMSYRPNAFTDNLKSATSMYFLVTSPSYYMQNLTQFSALTAPVIAGKHGYAGTFSEARAAYREIGRIWGKDVTAALDVDKIGNADVRRALQEIADRGGIDIGIDSEMGRFHSMSKGVVSTQMAKVDAFLRNLTRKAEAINRVVTVMSAYNLEKAALSKRGGMSAEDIHSKAVEYAYNINRQTNGSYDGFNAPRLMRTPVGSVVTQFKKFQLMQLTLLGKLATESFKGASPVERAIARKSLAYTMGHTAILAGAMGLPGAAAAEWFLNTFLLGDDDEPGDIEKQMRDAIGDDTMADLILKGAPTMGGVDISSRVGMGQALSLLPFTDIKPSQEGYNAVVTSLLGPAIGGAGPRFADGTAKMLQGNYWKGLERFLPKGISDASAAIRERTQGVTKNNNDMLLDPEDITFADTFARVMGVQTSKVATRYRLSNEQYAKKDFYNARAQEVNNQFANAWKQHDASGMAEARAEFRDLQTARVKNGLSRQPFSVLLRYAREQQRRERATVRGVQYQPKSPALQAALAEDDE